jgi:hypothetical protein
MTKKDRFHCLTAGAFIVTSLTTYSSTVLPKEDIFSLKETSTMNPCYWLSREIPAEGLCGARMRPDTNVLIQEAKKGNTIAAMRLGQLYRSGNWGVKQDFSKAILWFTRAATQGDRYSQIQVALAYEFGRMGTREDISLAIQFYKMATENGIYPDLEEKIDNLEKILSHSNN